ncbi:MAG: cysteine--tRNA ligase [Eggerthellaceae bacterium]|nr:cysteine--tRNA ligase [Eggerthellaceae bacterium]
MGIRLYDTKLRRKVDFEPLEAGHVRMYVCGPTVYNRIHIGNARTFIAFDTIRRYLEWRGFKVTFVQNVTDVDDKIIKRANDEGRTAAEVAAEYTEAFIADMHAAGVADPTVRPKATEEIDTMIELVQQLIDGGHAYEVDGDVYFAVRSYAGYGALSGRNVDEMEGGHRELRADGQGLEDRKRDPLDFALWKAAKPGEPSWESPWGPGRPGWHIECSAMSHKYLGLPFDIHGGGADLVFPHHENERAQSEAAYGCTFANHWMHSGMLQVANAETGEAEKMSKSLNNFLLLHEALELVRPEALRMLTLQTHYRSPLVFGDQRLAEADAALTRIENAVRNVDWQLENAADESGAGAGEAAGGSPVDTAALSAAVEAARAAFTEAMDDDFNAPEALGAVFTLVGEMNAALGGVVVCASDTQAVRSARDAVVELMGVLGIDVTAAEAAGEDGAAYPDAVLTLAAEVAGFAGTDKQAAVDALLEARAAARKEKNWAVADAVRDGLAELGFTVEDTPQGARVTYEG